MKTGRKGTLGRANPLRPLAGEREGWVFREQKPAWLACGHRAVAAHTLCKSVKMCDVCVRVVTKSSLHF